MRQNVSFKMNIKTEKVKIFYLGADALLQAFTALSAATFPSPHQKILFHLPPRSIGIVLDVFGLSGFFFILRTLGHSHIQNNKYLCLMFSFVAMACGSLPRGYKLGLICSAN
jgi:hypothetical protein